MRDFVPNAHSNRTVVNITRGVGYKHGKLQDSGGENWNSSLFFNHCFMITCLEQEAHRI